ncbi:hypothetical protein GIB67_025196 [Kingdonia uniflora]|uniref:EF-hand domain-containing protein n=1 Tax=Kingdonia uniflora TaxID=39325 RepID=A0A7J7N8H1_9MAGN|nr:hypothetical protein GIB67_025196 [Kingdonia uniflora]
MLDVHLKHRLTAQQVLDHPWLQHVKKAPNVSLGETVKARLKQFSVMNNLKRRVLMADVDGNGTLDFGEYVAVAIHLKKIGNNKYLHKAFTFFDKNKSEYIEIEELKDVLADEVDTNNEEVITAIIHVVDTDKDGKISYEEFTTMMKAETDWRKASRQYSRERFNNHIVKLMKDGTFEV